MIVRNLAVFALTMPWFTQFLSSQARCVPKLRISTWVRHPIDATELAGQNENASRETLSTCRGRLRQSVDFADTLRSVVESLRIRLSKTRSPFVDFGIRVRFATPNQVVKGSWLRDQQATQGLRKSAT